MISLVCFDLDGVLVDTVDWHYQSFNKAMKLVTGGDFITREEQEAFFDGRPSTVKLQKLMFHGRVRSQEDADEIAALKSRYFSDMVREADLHDLTKIGLMLSLKENGYKIAVVSNCNFLNTTLLLDCVGVLNIIDLRISASDVDNPKPSPEGYLRAMAQLGGTPDTTIIFEDSKVGLEAATLSGAYIVPVRSVKEVTWPWVMSKIRSVQ